MRKQALFILTNEIPINGIYNELTHVREEFTASYDECVDCRLAYGTNKQPAFWK